MEGNAFHVTSSYQRHRIVDRIMHERPVSSTEHSRVSMWEKEEYGTRLGRYLTLLLQEF